MNIENEIALAKLIVKARVKKRCNILDFKVNTQLEVLHKKTDLKFLFAENKIKPYNFLAYYAKKEIKKLTNNNKPFKRAIYDISI